MYLIGTKQQAESYIAKVDSRKGFSGNVTATWATPRQHPTDDKYAVPKCVTSQTQIEPDSSMEEVQELSSDWSEDDPLA
jgi:hypothetical protein